MKYLNKFYVFLLAIYPVLFLYSHNLNELGHQPFWLIVIMIASLALAVIFYFFISKLVVDKTKAGIYSAAFLTFFFSYEYFRNILNKANKTLQIGFFEHQYLMFLSVWVLIFVVLFYFLRKSKTFIDLGKFLNVFALTLIILALTGVVRYTVAGQKNMPDTLTMEEKKFVEDFKKKSNQPFPDVYYIVPDGYGNFNALQEYFGYNSAEFVKFLNQKEFQVAKHSRSNYPNTQFSLAASLNMNYVDSSATEGSAKLMEMIRYNKVLSLFKALGYKFVTFDSGYAITNYKKNADVLFDGGFLGEFPLLVLRSTALQPLFTGYWSIGYNFDNEMRKRILYTFDKLGEEVPQIEGPKFVIAHVNLPHMPYLLDRNGKAVYVAGYGESFKPEDMSAFLDYSIFGAKKIQEAVDRILKNSKTPPVIIVQSDHGFTIGEDEGKTDTSYSDKGVRIRFSNLSAYHLPGIRKGLLPQDLTPVNTFRFIFNSYFGAKYPLLANKHYFRIPIGGSEFPEVSASKLR